MLHENQSSSALGDQLLGSREGWLQTPMLRNSFFDLCNMSCNARTLHRCFPAALWYPGPLSSCSKDPPCYCHRSHDVSIHEVAVFFICL